jgi:hypothetical protein
MNERILKLFMQACRHADYEHQNVPKELVEKFSELIVRECAKIADSADESACEWIGGNILTHFGVEE